MLGAGVHQGRWRIQEEDEASAQKEFEAIKPGRSMRLVLVTRKVLKEKS